MIHNSDLLSSMLSYLEHGPHSLLLDVFPLEAPTVELLRRLGGLARVCEDLAHRGQR